MKTILVVDDDERIGRIIGQTLRRRGYSVVIAPNALEAHRLITEDRRQVDLILLDLNMPGIQGEILFEVLRTFHAKTQVIVCSVLPLEEQARRVPEALGYYDKADRFSLLFQQIKAAFGEKDEMSTRLPLTERWPENNAART